MNEPATPVRDDPASAVPQGTPGKIGFTLHFLLPVIAILCACAAALSYWPGLVTWDSLRQYDQALSGDFDDWHPPVMEWIWRQMLPLAHGPAPMLILQILLYALGFGLLVRQALRGGRTGLAIAIGCCALLPISLALMGTILKDSLMTGALLCAAGLAGLADGSSRSKWTIFAGRNGALFFCLFACTLRFNAFTAALPLALWALPARFRATPLRCAVSAVLIMPFLMTAMPVANRLIGAASSDVELSLIIFDLGGITERSGENQFPPLDVSDPVTVNHRCYTPVKWDSYSWWTADLCSINFEGVRTSFRRHGIDPKRFWLSAIVHHPLAYTLHRLAHWNIETRFIVADEIERPVQIEAPPNDWGFAITPNPFVSAVDWVALQSARTPLGWPCVWIAAMVGVVWASRRLPLSLAVRALSWSALLYGLGYGVFGVAAELRYYLWTMIAGALAIVLVVRDLRGRMPASRAGELLSIAALPALLTLLCVFARFGRI